MNDILICPKTHKKLNLSADGRFYQTDDGENKYPIEEGVIRFIEKNDEFYEGAYTATVKWTPKSEKWFHIWPLWSLSSGYIWEVRKNILPNARVLEIGCGGGVNYFGNRFSIIGLDLSFNSLLNCPKTYKFRLMSNAKNIPLASNSLDAVISCSFWEHIPIDLKYIILDEIKRVLKADGKVLFFYDQKSENYLIKKLISKDYNLYSKLFLETDGHLGYHTYIQNEEIFKKQGFEIIKHFSKERTIVLSSSALSKLIEGKVLPKVTVLLIKILELKFAGYLYNIFVKTVDQTVGKLFDSSKGRVVITIMKKRCN